MKKTKTSNGTNLNILIDPLVDRDCIMLDGRCDCPRLPGKSFPECKRYPTSVVLEGVNE